MRLSHPALLGPSARNFFTPRHTRIRLRRNHFRSGRVAGGTSWHTLTEEAASASDPRRHARRRGTRRRPLLTHKSAPTKPSSGDQQQRSGRRDKATKLQSPHSKHPPRNRNRVGQQSRIGIAVTFGRGHSGLLQAARSQPLRTRRHDRARKQRGQACDQPLGHWPSLPPSVLRISVISTAPCSRGQLVPIVGGIMATLA